MESFLDFYKDKTVLITGDTGFKGSWFAIWLLTVGANVIGYGFKSDNIFNNYSICNLYEKYEHIDGDIRDYESLLETIKKYKPGLIFHFAAQALVLDSYQDPVNTYTTNIMGTVNLFEAIRNSDCVKVCINVTSDKCYDNREWIYSYREIDALGGKDPYSASKSVSEIITSSYVYSFFDKEHSTKIASVRAGNVIGGGDWSRGRIVPDCITSLNNSQPIILRNPESIRPWQYVLEPLSGYLVLGSCLYNNGEKYTGAWNFGPMNNNSFSVVQLVKEIIDYWGNGNYIVDEKNKKKEANLLKLDISKAGNLLSWFPVLSFKESVKLTVEEYKIENFNSNEVFEQRLEHIKYYTTLRKT